MRKVLMILKFCHFIDCEGGLKSRNLKLRHESLERIVQIWILHHILLIEADNHVYSMHKLGMKQNELFSWDSNESNIIGDFYGERGCIINCIPNVCIQFLSVKAGGEADAFSLTEVSFDHSREDEWKDGVADNQRCCYSVKYDGARLEADIETEFYLRFRDDGSYIFVYNDYAVSVSSIHRGNSGLEVKQLWRMSKTI